MARSYTARPTSTMLSSAVVRRLAIPRLCCSALGICNSIRLCASRASCVEGPFTTEAAMIQGKRITGGDPLEFEVIVREWAEVVTRVSDTHGPR